MEACIKDGYGHFFIIFTPIHRASYQTHHVKITAGSPISRVEYPPLSKHGYHSVVGFYKILVSIAYFAKTKKGGGLPLHLRV